MHSHRLKNLNWKKQQLIILLFLFPLHPRTTGRLSNTWSWPKASLGSKHRIGPPSLQEGSTIYQLACTPSFLSVVTVSRYQDLQQEIPRPLARSGFCSSSLQHWIVLKSAVPARKLKMLLPKDEALQWPQDFVPLGHVLHFLDGHGYLSVTDCDSLSPQLEGLKAN